MRAASGDAPPGKSLMIISVTPLAADSGMFSSKYWGMGGRWVGSGTVGERAELCRARNGSRSEADDGGGGGASFAQAGDAA